MAARALVRSASAGPVRDSLALVADLLSSAAGSQEPEAWPDHPWVAGERLGCRGAERLPVDIAALLSEAECAAVGDRARELAELGSLPYDESGRRYPWPLV